MAAGDLTILTDVRAWLNTTGTLGATDDALISGLISPGSAKMTSARSPIIPARTKAGAFFCGPSSLASVFSRRFRSQNLRVSPLAVVTV